MTGGEVWGSHRERQVYTSPWLSFTLAGRFLLDVMNGRMVSVGHPGGTTSCMVPCCMYMQSQLRCARMLELAWGVGVSGSGWCGAWDLAPSMKPPESIVSFAFPRGRPEVARGDGIVA